MKFFGWALRALVCSFVLTALPALAQPTLKQTRESGAVEGREWEFQLLTASGAADVSERINAALAEVRLGWIRHSSDPKVTGIMQAVTANDDLVSIVAAVVEQDPQRPIPAASFEVLNFDARSGARIAPAALFVPGGYSALKREVASRLLAEGVFASEEASLQQAPIGPAVDEGGLTFFAAGDHRVFLPWDEVREHVDFSGALRSFREGKVDLALGADGPSQVEQPTSPPQTGEGLYLGSLEAELHASLPTLSVATKRHVLQEARWTLLAELEPMLAELDREAPEELRRAVHEARRSALEQIELDRAPFADAEARTIVDAVVKFAEIPGARVVGTKPLPMLSTYDGATLVQLLEPGAVVGLEVRNVRPGYHQVRDAQGTPGYVSAARVLLEAPYTAEARVHRLPSGDLILNLRTVNGSPVGPTLLPMDGPGQADAQLEALAQLIDPATGSTPPLYVDGTRREIAGRPAWLAIERFERVEDGAGEGSTPGIAEQLGGR